MQSVNTVPTRKTEGLTWIVIVDRSIDSYSNVVTTI
jgi:hypothetical protein